eukprot:5857775-Pyramimonas_sp.AAC.3
MRTWPHKNSGNLRDLAAVYYHQRNKGDKKAPGPKAVLSRRSPGPARRLHSVTHCFLEFTALDCEFITAPDVRFSHDGPIRRRERGYILTMDQFIRWLLAGGDEAVRHAPPAELGVHGSAVRQRAGAVPSDRPRDGEGFQPADGLVHLRRGRESDGRRPFQPGLRLGARRLHALAGQVLRGGGGVRGGVLHPQSAVVNPQSGVVMNPQSGVVNPQSGV